MSPQIAQYILIILLILSWGGILIWLVFYITIKGHSPYALSKTNKRFMFYLLLMLCGIFAIFDFTLAGSSDLNKIEQYLVKAQQENNQDLLITIQQIKSQPQISIRDRKYIEKLIEKGI